MTHALQVLLDVLAVVGDATGRDARLPHQLKADLTTQVVGDVTLLPLLVHLREELVHVRHVLVVLSLNAGLLGPDVAVVLITLVVPLALFQLLSRSAAMSLER